MKYKMKSKEGRGEFHGHIFEAKNLKDAEDKVYRMKGVNEYPTTDDYDLIEYTEARGRPPKFEKTTVMSIRIPTDLYDKIPRNRQEFIREAIRESLDEKK